MKPRTTTPNPATIRVRSLDRTWDLPALGLVLPAGEDTAIPAELLEQVLACPGVVRVPPTEPNLTEN